MSNRKINRAIQSGFHMGVDAIGSSSSVGDTTSPSMAGGFTKDRLSAIASKLSSTDPQGSANLGKIVSNFSAVDKNGDGRVSASELKSYAKDNNIELPKHIGHGGHGRHRQKAAEPQSTSLSDMQILLGQSTNGVTSDSTTDPLLASFDTTDTSQDGSVDLSALTDLLEKQNTQANVPTDPAKSAAASTAAATAQVSLQTYTASGVVEDVPTAKATQDITV